MISYRTSIEKVSEEYLEGFFVGWGRKPSPRAHLHLLAESDHVVLAMDGERVVGFVTALSDGVLCAYLSFLEVLPDYQRRGIGSELVRRVLAQVSDIYTVDLLTDRELEPFYARLGMQPQPGMTRKVRFSEELERV